MIRKSITFLMIIALIHSVPISTYAASIDNTHIACYEIDAMVLGTIRLECNINLDGVQSDPQFKIQISGDGKNWKDAPDSDRITFTVNSACTNLYGIKIAPSPLENPTNPQCQGFRIDFEPVKPGSIFLRLNVDLDAIRYVSNAVPFEVSSEVIAEQAEARAIDARNRAFILTVKWPYKIPVGIPYKLTVQSKDKYSGICTIKSIVGSPISYLTFNMKNGVGKTSLRGLRTGNAHVNISCRQASGNGPYASAYADVYFSR